MQSLKEVLIRPPLFIIFLNRCSRPKVCVWLIQSYNRISSKIISNPPGAIKLSLALFLFFLRICQHVFIFCFVSGVEGEGVGGVHNRLLCIYSHLGSAKIRRISLQSLPVRTFHNILMRPHFKLFAPGIEGVACFHFCLFSQRHWLLSPVEGLDSQVGWI